MHRLISLDGGRNFRDLGGYPTADGRYVRWHQIYRSGLLSHLSDADCSYLGTLGIKVVVDFRTAGERLHVRNRWLADGAERLQWKYDATPFSLEGLLRGAEPSIPNVKQAMIGLYESLPNRFAEPYRALFARLASGNLPLLMNCSAGKDRTGLAAALVLTSLGVDREHVISDYCLTNDVIDLERTYFPRSAGGAGLDDIHQSFAKLTPEMRAPLFTASPAYLQAAFRAIERDYGSLVAYLETALQVNAATLERMRNHLLESVPAAPTSPQP